jgi:hypothetical protein
MSEETDIQKQQDAWMAEAEAAIEDARRLARRLIRLDLPHTANSMHAVAALLVVRIEERSPV